MKLLRYSMLAIAVLGLLNMSHSLLSRGGGGGHGGGGHGGGGHIGGGHIGGFHGGGLHTGGFSGAHVSGGHISGGRIAGGRSFAGVGARSHIARTGTMHTARAIGPRRSAFAGHAGVHGFNRAGHAHFNNHHGWHSNWNGWGGWGWRSGLWWGYPWWGWFGWGFYPWFWLWPLGYNYYNQYDYDEPETIVYQQQQYTSAIQSDDWYITNETGKELTFSVGGKNYTIPTDQTVAVTRNGQTTFTITSPDGASGTFQTDDIDLYVFERNGTLEVETE